MPAASPGDGTGSARSRLLLGLYLLLLGLAIFQLGRLALYLANPGDFPGIGPGSLLRAAGRGLRFDLSILLAVAGGPLLILLAPLPGLAWQRWRWLWGGVLAALFASLVVILGADAVYFRFVHRHLGQELLLFFRDPAIAWASLIEYAWAVALGLAAMALASAAVLLPLRRPLSSPRRPLLAWSLWLLAIPLLVLGIRGGVIGKPIQAVNAYEGVSMAEGQLALNGPFVALRARARVMPPHDFLPAGEAEPAVRAVSPPGAMPGRPFAYRRAGGGVLPPGANVLVVMVESFGAQVGALRAAAGLPAGDATPAFDRLVAQGRFYPRFHATGQRSMEGLAAILAGVPTLPGLPYLGEGLEQTRCRYLGRIATDNGWSTFFIQGSVRTSYRVDAIAALAGFVRYQGAEDIAAAQPPPPRRNPMGAHDGDTLRQALAMAESAPKPFLGYVFTLSTHGPYAVPEARWETGEPGTLGRYRDSLRYADWALGRFVDEVRARPWGRDTLIVITGDHAWQDAIDESPSGCHRVPLLLLHPALPPASDQRIAAQPDLIPTLMDLCGWQGEWAGLGSSLLADPPTGRGAVLVSGDSVAWVDGDGWVQQQQGVTVGEGGGASGAAGRRRVLLAHQQVLIDALWRNRLLPGP